MRSYLILTYLGFLAACSGQQDASERNFKKTINAYNENHPVCLQVSLNVDQKIGFPIYLGDEKIVFAKTNYDGEQVNKIALKQMNILRKAGFYQGRKDIEENTAVDDKKPIIFAVFALTEKGKQQLEKETKFPNLCLGEERVKKINWFSEPTPLNGFTVSRVSYQKEYEWTKWMKKLISVGDEEWQKPFNYYKSSAQVTLVLTNEGWKDAREIKVMD